MTIRFICTGNLYRSRLAEAYCRSKNALRLTIMSSGTGTGWSGELAIAPHAARILNDRGLERFAAASWQQTTRALIRDSDIIVFMERKHLDFCKGWLDTKRQKIEVWNTQDIQQTGAAAIAVEATQTFEAICDRTDQLINSLRIS